MGNVDYNQANYSSSLLQQHKLMTETFFFFLLCDLMRFSHLQFPVNKNK